MFFWRSQSFVSNALKLLGPLFVAITGAGDKDQEDPVSQQWGEVGQVMSSFHLQELFNKNAQPWLFPKKLADDQAWKLGWFWGSPLRKRSQTPVHWDVHQRSTGFLVPHMKSYKLGYLSNMKSLSISCHSDISTMDETHMPQGYWPKLLIVVI